MSIKNKIRKDILWLLNEIEEQVHLTKPGDELLFIFRQEFVLPNGHKTPSKDRQVALLNRLEKVGVLKFTYYHFSKGLQDIRDWLYSPPDGYILQLNKKKYLKITGIYKNKFEADKKNHPEDNANLVFAFEFQSKKLSIGDKHLTLPTNSIELYLVDYLTNQPSKDKYPELDIAEYISEKSSKGEYGKPFVYDAMNRINKKVADEFEIKELIKHENSHFWLNHSINRK